MGRVKTGSATGASGEIDRAQRDVVMLGILVAAILLFAGTGSSVMASLVRKLSGEPGALDPTLSSALILNVALILFGWRRYTELHREIGERRKAEATAFRLAETDPLTGCLNRRSIYSAAGKLIAEARKRDQDVVVMMIDLDRFKHINDVYGHQGGDTVLLETANRIRALLPEQALLARLGGDEFACVTEAARGHHDATEALVTRMIEAIGKPIGDTAPQLEVTASIGLATCERANEEDPKRCAEKLLHLADLAMYQAKKRGRNDHVWFEGDMAREMKFRSDLERGIREGIANGEFVPFYEKQVDIDTGELMGFEMLARWKSPRHGLVNPEVFIPVAEEIGAISELSEALIAQALRDAREWDPRLSLSVNISPVQLRDPWFAQKLLKLLIEANFPPSRLDIEITESCLHENIGVVRSLVTSLKNQGIHISLDDFGTGYNSLSQLQTLPFDRIKIDRSFIASLMDSKESETIVRAITSLSAGMNLPITAEGIETDVIVEQLKELGRFKGQGYLYGKPSDADAVRALLAAEHMLVPAPETDETPEEDSPAARSA